MDFFDNNRTPISRDTIPDGLRFVYSKEKKKVWFAKRVLLGNICVTEKLSLQRGFDLVQLLGTMPSHERRRKYVAKFIEKNLTNL